MAAAKQHSSRYNSYDLRSSNSSDLSSSIEHKSNQQSKIGSNRPIVNSIVKSRVVDQNNNLSSMVKKFMEKRSTKKPLFVPADFIAEDLKKVKKKGPNFGDLHKKLFGKGGGGGFTAGSSSSTGSSGSSNNKTKALTEVKSNTRTLAMVLRSERELLGRNKDLEDELRALNLIIQDKHSEVEKLKDLCLKQREEIKYLKDAILFPDTTTNSQLHDQFHKQELELKQAKQIVPSLQKQVTSLTNQLQCLAQGLAEVKADKYASSASFERNGTPQTPSYNQEKSNSLELNSGDPTSPVSSDLMFLNDINPCLTPFYAKTKSTEFEVEGYESAEEDIISETNNGLETSGRRMSRSSEYYYYKGFNQVKPKVSANHNSNESKYKYGKPTLHHHIVF